MYLLVIIEALNLRRWWWQY